MNKFIHLHKTFYNSGISGRPITDAELEEWKALTQQLAEYMDYRGDKTMAASFLIQEQDAERMIINRKFS